ncbi:MAG: penicillin-binding transpeptidase domain-containing protein [Cyanobacteriota bacterium]|nr:penicillin-binding transpeptidase domain-containing protein [Cyanobacteriota bacterium]
MTDLPPGVGCWSRRRATIRIASASLLAGLSPTLAESKVIGLAPEDFAVILNLRTGWIDQIWHPQQLDRRQAPPASLAKLVTAAIALESGLTNPARRIPCPGWFQPPGSPSTQRLACWDHRGHGSLNLVEALAHSCNVHFYTLGRELGRQRLWQGLEQFGLGNGDYSGQAPLLAVGEDPHLQVNGWQLLRLIALIARQGQGIPEGDITFPSLPLADSIWQTLTAGMVAATQIGTAQGIGDSGQAIAVKTGTSARLAHPQWAEDFQAWLGAFWPAQDPLWAMLLYLHRGKAYQGGIGLARQIITAQSN